MEKHDSKQARQDVVRCVLIGIGHMLQTGQEPLLFVKREEDRKFAMDFQEKILKLINDEIDPLHKVEVPDVLMLDDEDDA
jgi:hypothetical protein